MSGVLRGGGWWVTCTVLAVVLHLVLGFPAAASPSDPAEEPAAPTSGAGTAAAPDAGDLVPSIVVAAGGGGQSAPTRSPFPSPFTAIVVDNNGQPVADVTVTFRVVTGGNFTGTASFPGGAATADVVTGADGGATSPILTAGASVGVFQVQATAAPGVVPASFALRVTYAQAASVQIISGDTQRAVAGTAFPAPLVVKVLDAQGFPVLNDTRVRFSVRSGTASFAGGSTVVDEPIRAPDGISTSPTLIAGSTPGTVQVAAEVLIGNVPSATFTATITEQVPTTIRVTGGNYQFATPGAAFAVPLTARVLDQAGNPDAWAPVTATVTGPATIWGRTEAEIQTGQDGSVSLPLMAAESFGGPVSVTLTSGSASATFTEYVNGRGPVTMTASRGGGQQVLSGEAFPQPLQALILDGNAMVIPGFPVTFTIEGPAVFPGGASSATVLSGAGSEGLTTSPTLTATNRSGPVTVTVTMAGTSASTRFDLTVRPTASLTVVAGDGQTIPPNSVWAVRSYYFPTPLTVVATDAGTGRPAVGVVVTFTVQGPARFQGNLGLGTDTAAVATGADGRAAAPALFSLSTPGTVTVTATAPGFTSAHFTEIVSAGT